MVTALPTIFQNIVIHIERQHVPFLICLVTRVREKIDSRTPSIPNLCDDYNWTLAEEPRLFTIPADPEFTVHRGNPTVFVCKAEVPDPTLITDLKWISPEGLEIGVSDRAHSDVKKIVFWDFSSKAKEFSTPKEPHEDEQQAVIGKEFKVKCVVKAKAYDVLTVHWFKDGIDISESKFIIISNSYHIISYHYHILSLSYLSNSHI
ncbi:hypothetical protein QYM36_015130 [Artemia franciscana]|uniref:Ig-like domain-containing protein n=1 Tax=Artemia franciscana TaxID=6661 RepID=A0AA88L4A6_ARTSF|nr:hypothetical protein QYM36_015130 [Artemia franciscana]